MLTGEMGADLATAQRLNSPRVDLASALDPNLLTDYLDEQYASHRAAAVVLCDRYERFLVATKDGIADEHICGIATDFREQVKAGIADCDKTRSAIKAPVLQAQRLIDGAAKAISDPLANLLPIIEQRIAAFLAAKARAEREAAEREAQRLAAAALDAMHQNDHGEVTNDVAIEALQAAQEAEARATASLPELSRVRSVHNSVAGLSDNWEYGITHPDLVPRQFLMVNDAAVKAAIKGGAREIPGLSIFNSPRVYTRKGR
jgi:hypothetical protein